MATTATPAVAAAGTKTPTTPTKTSTTPGKKKDASSNFALKRDIQCSRPVVQVNSSVNVGLHFKVPVNKLLNALLK